MIKFKAVLPFLQQVLSMQITQKGMIVPRDNTTTDVIQFLLLMSLFLLKESFPKTLCFSFPCFVVLSGKVVVLFSKQAKNHFPNRLQYIVGHVKPRMYYIYMQCLFFMFDQRICGFKFQITHVNPITVSKNIWTSLHHSEN